MTQTAVQDNTVEIGTYQLNGFRSLFDKGKFHGVQGVGSASRHGVNVTPNGTGIDVEILDKKGVKTLHTFHITERAETDIPDQIRKRHFGA